MLSSRSYCKLVGELIQWSSCGLDRPKVPLIHPSLGPRTHSLPSQPTRANVGVSCDEFLDRLAAADRERNTSDRLGCAVRDDCTRTRSSPEDVRDRIEG